MGEEILSPTSPDASRSPPQHQIQLSQNRKAGQGNALLDTQTYELPKGGKAERGNNEQKERGREKTKWPGLNVVTNFSKPPIMAQKVAQKNKKTEKKQEHGLGLKEKEVEPTPLSRSTTVESLGLRHQQSGTQTTLKPSSSKGRIGDLSRASSKWSNLSPSDRAVVIGISVSPEELDQHVTSPETGATEPKGLTEQHAIDRRPSNAPSIVITPAKETAPWSATVDEPVAQRKRAASSVYSQYPPQHGNVIDSELVPPIPPLPPDAKRHNAQVIAAHDMDEKNSHAGIVSTCTVFDEEADEGQVMGGQLRPGSSGSHLRILTKRASMDSVATKHRSQGWWNHIVSPFFPKSPMTFKFGSSTPPKQDSATTTKAGHDRNEQTPLPQSFPPRAMKSEGPESAHTSWTDSTMMTHFDEKKGLAKDHRRETFISDEPQEDLAPSFSPEHPKHEGFGAAAEYYEACLYDMHSSTPYFECINHKCLPTRTDSRSPPAVGMAVPTARGVDVGIFDPSTVAEQPNFLVPPTNRFSAAFHEAVVPRSNPRPQSDATMIEDLDTTPEIHEATAAPLLRAPEPKPAVDRAQTEPKPKTKGAFAEPQQAEYRRSPPFRAETPRQSPANPTPKQERTPKKYIAVMPPDRQPAPYETKYEQPLSPEPVSPVMQKKAPRNSILLNEVRKTPLRIDTMQTLAGQGRYDRPPPPPRNEDQASVFDLYPPPRQRYESPARRPYKIKEKELPPREAKRRGCQERNCFSKAKPKNKKEKRIMMAIAAGLFLLIILILVLCMTLTRKGDKMLVQSQWLNLTNFPPMPTGVSTIVQPNNIAASPDCIEPSTMWSCAIPAEEQQAILPNAPSQPNFRVEISFLNGTNATSNATNGNASAINRRAYGHIANAVSAGSFIRSRLLRVRNAFSSNTYTPLPAPPSLEEQSFLGNTTDGNAAPFNGEFTPFFMTFEAATKLQSRLEKRQSDNTNNNDNNSTSSNNDASSFPDPSKTIPPPATNPDGTAAPAMLYPYPSAQPLRLFDRGRDTEHYGFYTYFDRSIFLKTSAPISNSSTSSSSSDGVLPIDEDGGINATAASVRCTWAQTRFLVQIWTKKSNLATLLSPSPNTNSNKHPHSTTHPNSLTNSSANDFAQPGSFPYPVSITLDRHGGDIEKKEVYCYGIDGGKIVDAQVKIQLEERGVGGVLVNPAMGPFGHVNVTRSEGGPGGIDGGSGGCECRWVNWN